MKKLFISCVSVGVLAFIYTCANIRQDITLSVTPTSYSFSVNSTQDLQAIFLLEVRDSTTGYPVDNYKVYFSSPFAFGEGCHKTKTGAWGEFREYPNGPTLACPGYVVTDRKGTAEVYFVFYPYTIDDERDFDIIFWAEGNSEETGTKVTISLSPLTQ